MNYRDYLEAKPEVMVGKVVIKGTRITAELIVRKTAEGATITDILEMYPHITEEQAKACLYYASEVLANEVFIGSNV